MSERVFEVLLAIIIIPYGLLFLMQFWIEFGPLLRSRRRSDAREQSDQAGRQ